MRIEDSEEGIPIQYVSQLSEGKQVVGVQLNLLQRIFMEKRLDWIKSHKQEQTPQQTSSPPSQEQAPPQNSAEQVQAPATTSSTGDISGNYHSDRHNIQISRIGNSYVYKSWNHPRDIDEGRPDFQLNNGEKMTVGEGDCSRTRVVMRTGDTTFEITEVGNRPQQCFNRIPANNASAELDIYINGRKKDHYWLYRK